MLVTNGLLQNVILIAFQTWLNLFEIACQSNSILPSRARKVSQSVKDYLDSIDCNIAICF